MTQLTEYEKTLIRQALEALERDYMAGELDEDIATITQKLELNTTITDDDDDIEGDDGDDLPDDIDTPRGPREYYDDDDL